MMTKKFDRILVLLALSIDAIKASSSSIRGFTTNIERRKSLLETDYIYTTETEDENSLNNSEKAGSSSSNSRIVFGEFSIILETDSGNNDAGICQSKNGKELVRNTAEDCLRESLRNVCGNINSFFQSITTVGLANPTCNDNEESNSVNRAAVMIYGGVISYAGGTISEIPTKREVVDCLKQTLEGDVCLQTFKQEFSNIPSIGFVYHDNIPEEDEEVVVPGSSSNSNPNSVVAGTETTDEFTRDGSIQSKSDGDGPSIIPIAGGVVAGAVLLVLLFGFIAISKRKKQLQDSEVENNTDKKLNSSKVMSVIEIEPVGTAESNDLDDPEACTKQVGPKESNKGESRLERVLAQQDGGNREIGIVHDDDNNTPPTTKNSSSGADSSGTSSLEEEMDLLADLAIEDSDDDGDGDETSSSSKNEDEQRLVYPTPTYDTRPIAVEEEKKKVIIVAGSDDEDDDEDDICNSPKRSWIHPALVASLRSFRLDGGKKAEAVPVTRTNSATKTKATTDVVEVELLSKCGSSISGKGGETSDYELDQDWDPDDASVTTVDAAAVAMTGTGELAFHATKPLLSLPEPPVRNTAAIPKKSSTRSLKEWLQTVPTTTKNSTSSLPTVLQDQYQQQEQNHPSPKPQRRTSTPRLFIK